MKSLGILYEQSIKVEIEICRKVSAKDLLWRPHFEAIVWNEPSSDTS